MLYEINMIPKTALTYQTNELELGSHKKVGKFINLFQTLYLKERAHEVSLDYKVDHERQLSVAF